MTNQKKHSNSNTSFSLNKAFNWATHVYFIGVGGIGMSALAKYFVACGKQVAGYDKTPSAITKALESLDISIHFEDNVNAIDTRFCQSETTLIVYTPAIPKDHKEFQYFETHNFTILKRSEVLGEITKYSKCLAVAGTHGKTTTTSILGHLLYQCHEKVTAFLGGIAENYNSNLILNGTTITVVEADEFDRSFLSLSPDIACITSLDADHLDIYGNKENLLTSFNDFTKKIKPNGKLLIRYGLPLSGITYSINDAADYSAKGIRLVNGQYFFNIKTPKGTYKNFVSQLPGKHNLLNTVAALAMAIEHGCDINLLKTALASYTGVKRRFSYQIKTEHLIYIDDYAHHPEEIKAVYDTVKAFYPKKKNLAIFQPHLYSRTRDFLNEFASVLSKFDQIILLEIYPARELPIEGVNATALLNLIPNPNKILVSKKNLITYLKTCNIEVVLTLGAGDIGDQVKAIQQILLNED